MISSQEARPFLGGAPYRAYLDPVVADRLINYYASDLTYARVSNVLAIADQLPELVEKLPLLNYDVLVWYTTPSIVDTVNRILQREPTLTSLVDDLRTLDPTSGRTLFENLRDVIGGAFFTKIADLVASHTNLIWYANVNTLTTANSLFQRAQNIVDLVDYVLSSGTTRFADLKDYLDTIHTSLKSLADGEGALSSIRTAIQGVADGERVTLDVVLDRFKTYLGSGVSGNLIEIQGWRNNLFDLQSWRDSIANSLNGIFGVSSLSLRVGPRNLLMQTIEALASPTGSDLFRIRSDLDLWDGTSYRRLLAGRLDVSGLFVGGVDLGGVRDQLRGLADRFDSASGLLSLGGLLVGGVDLGGVRDQLRRLADRFTLVGERLDIGDIRIWDKLSPGNWVDMFEIFDRSNQRILPRILRDRIQDRINGILGDTPLFRIFTDPDYPPEPWVKGMMYIQEIRPEAPWLPGATSHYYLRIYDGRGWLTLINDFIYGVNWQGAPT